MDIGNRIKQRRLSLGITAEDLAYEIGKSRTTIYRYENGDIENIPTTVLEPLAEALRTTNVIYLSPPFVKLRSLSFAKRLFLSRNP